MTIEDAPSIVSKGMEALSKHQEQLALTYFEQAIQLERTPQTCSCIAYCIAKVRGCYQEAVSLAREALESEPNNPLHYLNLGRVLSLSGDNRQAVLIFRKGIEYGMHFEFIRELELSGIRSGALFGKLSKNRSLNRVIGPILSLIKMK